jgi:hypothetical protein
MAGAVYSKAFGSQAGKDLFAALPAAPTGPAYSHFLADYSAVYHTSTPLPSTYDIYDSVIIAALAMTGAKSTDPSVWTKHVVDVASPPGITCSTYAACVSLLKSGKDINFEGAGGSDDFNSHHNVFSGFSVVGFASNPSGAQVSYVPAAAIARLSS